MAASAEGPVETSSPSPSSSSSSLDCAVCLQTCVHPAKLACGHIFCFLCIKGVAVQSKRCPMCRREIPPGFLEDPTLVADEEEREKHRRLEAAVKRKQEKAKRVREARARRDHDDDDDQEEDGAVGDRGPSRDADDESASSSGASDVDEVRWFYEGRNGWWQYDERTSAEIESFHATSANTCDLLIAGFLYTVDFSMMVQYRRNDPSRRRRIRRDLVSSVPRKGVAGIRSLQVGGGVDDGAVPPVPVPAAAGRALQQSPARQMASVPAPPDSDAAVAHLSLMMSAASMTDQQQAPTAPPRRAHNPALSLRATSSPVTSSRNRTQSEQSRPSQNPDD